MPVSTPDIITEAFGVHAGGGFITKPIPLTTATPGAASYDQGFPALTMQPIAGGGIPPFGQDMNGILYSLTSNVAALWAGQPYLYSSTVSTAIGGYAVGAILGMSDGSGLWLNTVAANTTDPDGGSAAGWVPLFRYGSTTVAGTSGTITLTPEQAKSPVIIITGALVGNLQVVFPATQQQWLIVNATTGGFAVTCAAGGSNNVQPLQGGYAEPTGIYGDGAGNLYPSFSPPNAAPQSVSPVPSTLVLRSNAGYVYATYLNQNSSSTENPTIGAFLVENAAADGFLRKASKAFVISQLYSQSIGASGYVMLPNGLIVQWGTYAGGSSVTGPQNYLVTLPTSFPNAFLMALASAKGFMANGQANAYCSANINSNSNFYIGMRDVANEGFVNNAFWLAVGY